MKLEEMSGPELLGLFNKISDKKVKSFKSREVARSRITSVLAKKDKTVDDIDSLLAEIASVPAPSAEKKTGKNKKTLYTNNSKIVILKSEDLKRTTGAQKRFLKLMQLEEKTVEKYLKAVGNKGKGDIAYWLAKGRIRVE